ncbi:MAG: aminopeptidase, partial [Defluviitaleaceae bacterium]|nr:aminopeptidase [Defluviitaleaceae bacterium]
KTGYDFVFNLPTYEVFTAPHRKAVNGIVYNTKPIFSKGNIIHDFWIKFEDGQVGDYKAEIGHDFLKEIITQHINGDYLGEVALVPHSSPISNFGFPLYHNLLDENASCHLALGQGYTTNLVDSDDLTEAERLTKGLNQCLSHTDFMIGSSCMNITGKTHDGQDVQVFTNGEWAI